MNKFIDRDVQHPNRKKLTVNEIKYDENGEISELLADVKRSEGKVYEEGTPLNASSLNEIIRNRIREDASMIVNNLFTNAQKITFDLEALELPTEVTASSKLYLRTRGAFGSNYLWSIREGTGITIENNIATINQTYEEQTVKLMVEAKYETTTKTKEFVVKVLAKEIVASTTLSVFPDGSGAGMASVSFVIDANSVVLVENEYSFHVTTSISNDNVLTITVSAGGYPEGGVMEATFKVIVKDKTTGFVTKDITITVEFLESLEAED